MVRCSICPIVEPPRLTPIMRRPKIPSVALVSEHALAIRTADFRAGGPLRVVPAVLRTLGAAMLLMLLVGGAARAQSATPSEPDSPPAAADVVGEIGRMSGDAAI